MKRAFLRCVWLCGLTGATLAPGGCTTDAELSADDRAAADSAALSDNADAATLEAADAPPGGSHAGLIRFLSIDSFRDLPPAVRDALAGQDCVVPQAFEPRTPHNVVNGEFASRGQLDWAALCARGDTAEIMVVWGGPITCPTPLAADALAHQMQSMAANELSYSRALSAAPAQYIIDRDREATGPRPSAISHSGIDDAFLGKASTVHYCDNGTWFLLPGAD